MVHWLFVGIFIGFLQAEEQAAVNAPEPQQPSKTPDIRAQTLAVRAEWIRVVVIA